MQMQSIHFELTLSLWSMKESEKCRDRFSALTDLCCMEDLPVGCERCSPSDGAQGELSPVWSHERKCAQVVAAHKFRVENRRLKNCLEVVCSRGDRRMNLSEQEALLSLFCARSIRGAILPRIRSKFEYGEYVNKGNDSCQNHIPKIVYVPEIIGEIFLIPALKSMRVFGLCSYHSTVSHSPPIKSKFHESLAMT